MERGFVVAVQVSSSLQELTAILSFLSSSSVSVVAVFRRVACVVVIIVCGNQVVSISKVAQSREIAVCVSSLSLTCWSSFLFVARRFRLLRYVFRRVWCVVVIIVCDSNQLVSTSKFAQEREIAVWVSSLSLTCWSSSLSVAVSVVAVPRFVVCVVVIGFTFFRGARFFSKGLQQHR